MSSWRRARPIGSVALSIMLLAGVPGLALAGGVKVAPANPDPVVLSISGTVTALVGGAAIQGIQVSVVGTGAGSGLGTATTNAGGAYTIEVTAADTFTVNFTDPNLKYLYGAYYTGAGNVGDMKFGYGAGTGVAVDAAPITGIDVQMTAGVHIKGTVTGPATPPNPIHGMPVWASGSANMYYAHTTTAADGSYSLLVPPNASYFVSFPDDQHLYLYPCPAAGIPCVGGETAVGATDATKNVQLALRAGGHLVLSPDDTTVAGGTGQWFHAQLTNTIPLPQGVAPAFKGDPTIDHSWVTAAVVFTINKGGTCSANMCIPPAKGDYTVTGSYGGETGTVVLHATAPAATPTPSPKPTPRPTPPASSTVDSTGGRGGAPLALLLLGLSAAALMVFGLRRRVQVHARN